MTRHIDNDLEKFTNQRWLVAHNAWNTEIAPNQCKTITELLDYGVRGFALDIYGDDEGSLHLQHGHGNLASATPWEKIRRELDVWLTRNEDQIVTLFFESYLTGPKRGTTSPTALEALDHSLRSVTGYKSGSNTQLDAISSKTLKDLVKDDHRLFAFIEKEPDEGRQPLFPTMDGSISQNVYGDQSLRIPTWVNVRHRSGRYRTHRPLTFMNHFGDAPTQSEWERNNSRLIVKHAEAFMFEYQGRYPNFISLDYINWTTTRRGPIKALNSLRERKDCTGATRFQFKGNGFDDVVFSIDDSRKIVGFAVVTDGYKGIVKIRPRRAAQGAGVSAVEVVNVPGRGVVDMRYEVGGRWSGWLAGDPAATNATSENRGMHTIRGDLVGICCRTQEGYGVVDFAAAYRETVA